MTHWSEEYPQKYPILSSMFSNHLVLVSIITRKLQQFFFFLTYMYTLSKPLEYTRTCIIINISLSFTLNVNSHDNQNIVTKIQLVQTYGYWKEISSVILIKLHVFVLLHDFGDLFHKRNVQ